jgi:hypothetical protein
MKKLNLEDYAVARSLLIKEGSVKKAVEQFK